MRKISILATTLLLALAYFITPQVTKASNGNSQHLSGTSVASCFNGGHTGDACKTPEPTHCLWKGQGCPGSGPTGPVCGNGYHTYNPHCEESTPTPTPTSVCENEDSPSCCQQGGDHDGSCCPGGGDNDSDDNANCTPTPTNTPTATSTSVPTNTPTATGTSVPTSTPVVTNTPVAPTSTPTQVVPNPTATTSLNYATLTLDSQVSDVTLGGVDATAALAHHGDVLRYYITVQPSYIEPLNVVVNDNLAGGQTFVSGSCSNSCSLTGSMLRFSLGNMTHTVVLTFETVVTAYPPSMLYNTATASGSNTNYAVSNTATVVVR